MFSCWMTPAGFGLASVVAEMMWSAFGLISDIAGVMSDVADSFILVESLPLVVDFWWLAVSPLH